MLPVGRGVPDRLDLRPPGVEVGLTKILLHRAPGLLVSLVDWSFLCWPLQVVRVDELRLPTNLCVAGSRPFKSSGVDVHVYLIKASFVMYSVHVRYGWAQCPCEAGSSVPLLLAVNESQILHDQGGSPTGRDVVTQLLHQFNLRFASRFDTQDLSGNCHLLVPPSVVNDETALYIYIYIY